MNSYFTNPSISCHLNGGQEVLPNVTLSSTNYDPVRHFSPYGAAVAPNRIYSNPFYSTQENVMFGSSRGPYEYGSNVFYQDKDVLPSCRQSLGQTQGSLTQDYASDQGKTLSQEPKGSIQIYPWMQRMNSHSGEQPIETKKMALVRGGLCFYDWETQVLSPHKALTKCLVDLI